MTDVQFNEEQQYPSRTRYQKTRGAISAWLIKNGFAKDEDRANSLMLYIISAGMVIAIGAPFLLGGSERSLSPQERARIERSTIPSPQANQNR